MIAKEGDRFKKRDSGWYDYYGGQVATVVEVSEYDARHCVVQFPNGRKFWVNLSNSEWSPA